MAAKSINEVLEEVLYSQIETVVPESSEDKCKKMVFRAYSAKNCVMQ